jgi:hypothetical protein
MLQLCLYGRCISFTHILLVFYLDVYICFCNRFPIVFQVFLNVSNTCFKCFICIYTYVANVSSQCFKSGSGVAHITMAPVANRQRPAVGLRLLPRAARLALSSPSPPFPSLPSISTWQLELGDRDDTDVQRARCPWMRWPDEHAEVMATQQAEVHAICSLRAETEQLQTS